MPGVFDVMGGTSVALLGYNVVVVKCKTDGTADVRLPTGFHAMCFLPPLHGTIALKTTTTTTGEGQDAVTTTETDPTMVTVSNAAVGDVFFVIGQN